VTDPTEPVVKYEIRDKIAYITINRPEKKNAINNRTSWLLWEAFTDVRDNPDVWVAIITGTGDTFSAGRDLVERNDVGDLPGPTNAEIYALQRTILKPTLAAVNVVCLAAASGLALNMDIRIGEKSTQFGWPHAKRGIASVSSPAVLARLVPDNIAFEYMYTGKFMSVEVADRYGLVNRVVDDGKALEACIEIAQEILTLAPMSMRVMKEARLRTTNMRVEDAYVVAKALVQKIDDTADKKEGLLAFKEKRPPVWQGR
jgi:enoyl-CoA hydratase/carnithine racemase